jgi:hypothetical protein
MDYQFKTNQEYETMKWFGEADLYGEFINPNPVVLLSFSGYVLKITQKR